MTEDKLISKTKNKILIINDCPSLNALLKLVLEGEGFSPVVALTGIEGIFEAGKGNFKLILLDYNLPDMTGIDVCKKLRSRRELNDIPIAFITAVEKDKIEKELISAGANAYINPPYLGKEFIKTVKKIIDEFKIN